MSVRRVVDFPLPLTFDNCNHLAAALSSPVEATSLEKLRDKLHGERLGNTWLFGLDRADLWKRIAFVSDFIANAAQPLLHRGGFFKNVEVRWRLAQELASQGWEFLGKVIDYVDRPMVNSVANLAANRGTLDVVPLSNQSVGYLKRTSLEYLVTAMDYIDHRLDVGPLRPEKIERYPNVIPKRYIADPKQSDWRLGVLLHMQWLGLVRQIDDSYHAVK